MNIRNLFIEDYDQLYNLWAKIPGIGLRSLDDSRDGIKKFLERNPTTNFVSTIDNKLVGSILCGHDGRRAYIYHTCVDPNYRGLGIGQKLVNKVISSLKGEGINKVSLVAFKENDIGNNFWGNIDFEKRVDLNYYNKSINPNNK